MEEQEQVIEKISFQEINPVDLLGQNDVKLRAIEGAFRAQIVVRGDQVIVKGAEAEVTKVVTLLKGLVHAIGEGYSHDVNDVMRAVMELKTEGKLNLQFLPQEALSVSAQGIRVRPKTTTQQIYVEAVRRYDIVFAIGPAGTGKTYLAVAMALSALKNQQVDRIVLVRPAVEAGESLGYLPGDPKEKVAPYLRPLYDALHDMLGLAKLKRCLDMGIIEIVPLAYMRGRTLNNAFVILDEAQNTTTTQMKMFLTRLGVHSKAVVTGDITQIDLPSQKPSGLIQIQFILKGIDKIKFIYFSKKDIVRHQLVQQIVKAYEHYEAEHQEEGAGPVGEDAGSRPYEDGD